MSVTFADLQALAIDTDALPPMTGRTGKRVRHDAKRSDAARRETRARRQARALKVA